MAIRTLPRRVEYFERDKKTKRLGYVTDVVSVDESYSWGDYRKEIQWIEWDKGTKAIRLAYYVKDNNAPDDEYGWGSQTTLILKVANAEKMFRAALRLLKKKRKLGQ